jgi:hypothetical protein
MTNELPHNKRNLEVTAAIAELRAADMGASAEKKAGIANSLSSLDVAESLQLLLLQLAESSKQNATTLDRAMEKLIKSNEKLSKSNERQVRAMQWLTGGLILVGCIQAFLIVWLQ